MISFSYGDRFLTIPTYLVNLLIVEVFWKTLEKIIEGGTTETLTDTIIALIMAGYMTSLARDRFISKRREIMDEKDGIIEKQIVNAMINPTENAINSINNVVESLDKRANMVESRLSNLESDVEELEQSMATQQDLENQRKEIEDEFKDMLTKSMYIVFALFFIAILFCYFF